jgi:hypothetical protein
MIDPTPLYLLDDPERAIEWLDSAGGPDSPQARRTAVLVAEAVAAGQADAVTATFIDWARVLLHGGHSTALVPLAQVITACDSLRQHVLPHADAQRVHAFLHDVIAEPHMRGAPADTVAFELACWTSDMAEPNSAPEPADAWHAATRMLGAIAEASGVGASDAITRCADCARARLLILVS